MVQRRKTEAQPGSPPELRRWSWESVKARTRVHSAEYWGQERGEREKEREEGRGEREGEREEGEREGERERLSSGELQALEM